MLLLVADILRFYVVYFDTCFRMDRIYKYLHIITFSFRIFRNLIACLICIFVQVLLYIDESIYKIAISY